MKKLFLVLIFIPLLSCQSNKEIEKTSADTWSPLWNGQDFTGWHTYLGAPYRIEEDSLGNPIEPFGIDNDPLEVIKIVEINKEKVIRISGVAWGMIYTEDKYKNYHLKLKVKWGTDKHVPRENEARDSGLLYHGFGEPGSAYYWMSSQELQIQQGDMGDYWPLGDVKIDIPSVPLDDDYYIYKENAERRTYHFADVLETNATDSLAKRRVFKGLDAEKPHGEWNDIELVTLGDSSIHLVNGKVVMRLFNSRQMSNDKPLDSGKIILQSEGAEVFYKDISIREITEIPEELK